MEHVNEGDLNYLKEVLIAAAIELKLNFEALGKTASENLKYP